MKKTLIAVQAFRGSVSIKELGEIKRSELENVLIPKIPEGLDISQKKDKTKNLLQKTKNERVIIDSGKMWRIKS